MILLDKTLNLNQIESFIKELQKLFQKSGKYEMSSDYNYVHSAKICEYLKIFNFTLKESRYKQFLSKAYKQYK